MRARRSDPGITIHARHRLAWLRCTIDTMLAALVAQPNLRQVPGVHEQILIEGRSVAFPHLWEVPDRGLVLVATPGTIITQRYVASEHRPGRNGQTAVVPVR